MSGSTGDRRRPQENLSRGTTEPHSLITFICGLFPAWLCILKRRPRQSQCVILTANSVPVPAVWAAAPVFQIPCCRLHNSARSLRITLLLMSSSFTPAFPNAPRPITLRPLIQMQPVLSTLPYCKYTAAQSPRHRPQQRHIEMRISSLDSNDCST